MRAAGGAHRQVVEVDSPFASLADLGGVPRVLIRPSSKVEDRLQPISVDQPGEILDGLGGAIDALGVDDAEIPMKQGIAKGGHGGDEQRGDDAEGKPAESSRSDRPESIYLGQSSASFPCGPGRGRPGAGHGPVTTARLGTAFEAESRHSSRATGEVNPNLVPRPSLGPFRSLPGRPSPAVLRQTSVRLAGARPMSSKAWTRAPAPWSGLRPQSPGGSPARPRARDR